MAEIVDKGELRRQLARSEGERLAALATIASLEDQLRVASAERQATAEQLAQIEHRLTALQALNAVQVVLTVLQAAQAVRRLTHGPWLVQLWRRLLGRRVLAHLTETVDKVTP